MSNEPEKNRIEELLQSLSRKAGSSGEAGEENTYKKREPSEISIPIAIKHTVTKTASPLILKTHLREPKSSGNYRSNYSPNLFKRFLIALGILALFLVLGFDGYKVFKSFSTADQNSGVVVQMVGKLVELPKGEDPTVATISDLKPLAGQEFFKDAELGDKVLIFGKSKKAILYRPSENKIIAISPINK
jgi:hypothetical protein